MINDKPVEAKTLLVFLFQKMSYTGLMIRRKITLRGITTTPLIDSWIEKIPNALERYVDNGDESAIVDIQIRRHAHQASGDRFFVEATLRAKKISLHAEAENENLPSAIEAVRDEIIEEFVSGKKRREHFVKKGSRMLKNLIRGMYNKKE